MAHEDSDAWRARDRATVWHPFTQQAGWADEDFPVVVGAEGFHIIDADGRRLIDGISSLWCNVHGHRVPAIDAAIRAQLDRAAHTTFLGSSHPAAIELAERLVAAAPPGLARVFYSDSGSEAVEVALKMTYQFWRQTLSAEERKARPKNRYLALGDAYHGDTLGAVSVGGIDLFHEAYRPLLFEAVRLPGSACYRCPYGKRYPECRIHCAEEIARTIGARHAELAAVVVEPLVQGAAGMIVQPPGFLRTIAEACRRHDVLLIADEVATGFGRTGTLFACAQEGVSPDLLAVAKGLTGGYLPLAATLATERVYSAFLGPFESKRTFFHGHTYTANPLSCAAALASLDLLERDRVLEGLPPKIARVAAWGEALRRGVPAVGDVRQRGLMAGIELVRDRATREPFPFEARMGHRVAVEARKRGALLRPLGDVVVLMPAPAMPIDVLDELLRITADAIRAAVGAKIIL